MSAKERTLREVAEKLEWEGGPCGLADYLGGDLDSVDAELNAAWERFAVVYNELTEMLEMKLPPSE